MSPSRFVLAVSTYWCLAKGFGSKQHIGVLLKAVRNVCGLDIQEQCDFGESFGESLHSARSEPYYYESAYNFEHRPSVLVVDSYGRCRLLWEM